MDDPAASRGDIDASLRFLRFANRRLGGVGPTRRLLAAWSRRWPRDRPVTLIDVATGAADVPVALRTWALRAGFDLRITAVDLHETTLDLARERLVGEAPRIREGVTLVQADARKLLDHFGPGAFDYAHSGLFLHHLSGLEALTVLRIMERLASAGMIWSDLARSRWAMSLLYPLVASREPIVKHDAIVSVRAGFTKREALDMRNRLDLDWCRFRWGLMRCRFFLAGEKEDAWR